jgi:dimethylamine monooxygenase subunit A
MMTLHRFWSDHYYVIGVIAVLIVCILHYSRRTKYKKAPSQKGASTTLDRKTIRRGPICPFSQGSDFIVETAEHLPLSPLESCEDWLSFDATNSSSKPMAARWLYMGLSGQDTPGILRAGLRRLRNAKYFLLEEPDRLGPELLLKKKALDDPNRFPSVFVAEEDSLPAQQECLDLFLEYLPRRYPNEYEYDSNDNKITVKCIDTTFHIKDWYDTRPLELCERIVQEDLVLMRPPKEPGESYRMAAAAVVFSFDDLPQKLGQPVEFIHAPVPGYEKHIRKSMNLTFSKLKVQQPMWRNNWGISPNAELDKPLYGSSLAQYQRTMSTDGVTEAIIRAKFLKVEYQTIRRLPKSSYLLFTVNTMVDPMYALEKVPPAATCLAASIRGMSPAMRKYKGIDNEEICTAVLQYLDSIGGGAPSPNEKSPQ